MENKKQSSVEWLIKEISKHIGWSVENTEFGKSLHKKAKQKHEEEIKQAYISGQFRSETANKYYNQIFKK
jgi:hypothetical protein